MHIEKFTRGQVIGLICHIERKYRNHSNEEIKPDMESKNYCINAAEQFVPVCKGQSKKRYEEILQRSDVKLQNRKDVNTAVSVCIHSPEGLSPEEEKRFFKYAYRFLKKRYCQYGNVISATIHKDENQKRAHMHFVFVPLARDERHPERLKVCAKNVVNRRDLMNLHKDCADYINQVFGRDMGIYNPIEVETTKDGKVKFGALLKAIKNKIPPKYYKKLVNIVNELGEKAYSQNIEILKLREEISKLKEEKDYLQEQIKSIEDAAGEVLDGYRKQPEPAKKEDRYSYFDR